MSTEVKTQAVEVVNKEQGEWIDQAKALLAAHATAEKTEALYIYAIGTRLHLIKDSCQHGQFEALKKSHFPDKAHRTLTRASTYRDAVDFFAKGKKATVAFLGQGELPLVNGDIPEKDKSKAAAELEEITKGRGVVELIADYRKKKAPKATPPTPAEEAEQKLDAARDFVEDLRSKMALCRSAMAESVAALPAAELKALDDDRIELGHFLASLRKSAKGAK